MKKFIALALFLISPVASIAGFPEGKNGYDLEKLEKSFRLPCNEIGNDDNDNGNGNASGNETGQ